MNIYLKIKRIHIIGFLVNKNVKPVTNLPTKRRLASYEFPKEWIKYLDEIVKICKDNDIKLVLIKAPSIYPYWYEEYNENVEEYAKENEIDYYNLVEKAEEIGLDYQTDTYDGGLHLNFYGAKKLSRYFSKILKKNYDLTDENYDEKYKNYIEATN